MLNSSAWQNISHDKILHAVEEVLQEKLSNLFLARNSYINRVYEIEKYASQERFIIKFYRPGRWTREIILEEHKFLEELVAKENPVIPPLKIKKQTLFEFKPGPIFFALFPKKRGRALDEFDKEGWEEIGRMLARIHLIGEKHKSSKRIEWKPSIATQHHLEILLKSDFLLKGFKEAFKKTADLFIKKADPLFNGKKFILLHGDCHKGNFIHRPGEGIFLVDFDDTCFGPTIQDIWMLLPDIPEKCEKEINWLSSGYETFRVFDREQLSLVMFLRGMRMIHFAAWLAIQSQEPDFPKHFPEAGKARYWNELIKELQELVFQ